MAHLLVGMVWARTDCSPARPRRRTRKELIHPGLPKLFALQSKESLVQTLEAYLDNGCDTKLTAEALFLHRASLYYRLQRIEAITSTSASRAARTGSRCTRASNWRAWWAYIQR